MEEQRSLGISNTPSNEDSTFFETVYLSPEHVEQKYVYRFTKRLIDIIGSIVGLIVLSPLFLIISVFIKLEEGKGPVFFSQLRVGKNEVEFEMYKFRSMCVGAENKLNSLLKHNEVEGAMFKMKNDPRVTKIGRFIRKTSIDELPQLWNVLKGDMSLVGPRPPLPREVEKYTLYAKQRLLVKPGITGIWQTSGRNSLTFNQMVNLDLSYIAQPSLWHDFIILMKTIKVVVFREGAY